MLSELKSFTLEELRENYRIYLSNAEFSANTIQTASSDAFYALNVGLIASNLCKNPQPLCGVLLIDCQKGGCCINKQVKK